MISGNQIIHRLKEWGFEKGWGDTAQRVKETMRAVSEVLQAPDPVHVEKLFSRLPAIFNIVIFSPHGYFGQSDVLGLPDTGGQVRYCFDLALKKVVCLQQIVKEAGKNSLTRKIKNKNVELAFIRSYSH